MNVFCLKTISIGTSCISFPSARLCCMSTGIITPDHSDSASMRLWIKADTGTNGNDPLIFRTSRPVSKLKRFGFAWFTILDHKARMVACRRNVYISLKVRNFLLCYWFCVVKTYHNAPSSVSHTISNSTLMASQSFQEINPLFAVANISAHGYSCTHFVVPKLPHRIEIGAMSNYDTCALGAGRLTPTATSFSSTFTSSDIQPAPYGWEQINSSISKRLAKTFGQIFRAIHTK